MECDVCYTFLRGQVMQPWGTCCKESWREEEKRCRKKIYIIIYQGIHGTQMRWGEEKKGSRRKRICYRMVSFWIKKSIRTGIIRTSLSLSLSPLSPPDRHPSLNLERSIPPLLLLDILFRHPPVFLIKRTGQLFLRSSNGRHTRQKTWAYFIQISSHLFHLCILSFVLFDPERCKEGNVTCVREPRVHLFFSLSVRHSPYATSFSCDNGCVHIPTIFSIRWMIIMIFCTLNSFIFLISWLFIVIKIP